MKPETGMNYYLVISNLKKLGMLSQPGLREEVSIINKSASEKVGPGFGKRGRKGISGMYEAMKVGKRNQTDLAGWQDRR